jgi:predicted ribosomally synthesized peptide with SipW-like signal peptide
MKIKKLAKTVVVFGVVAALSIGATVAYFTGGAHSNDNVFTTGSLSVSIDQVSPLEVENVIPGGFYQIDFDLTNTGSTPIFAKGYLDGTWSEPALSTQVISVQSVQIEHESSPYSITQFGEALGTEFLITSPDQIGMLEIDAGETITVKVGVKFSETMENEYQGTSLSLSLHLAAKQTVMGSDWPTEF